MKHKRKISFLVSPKEFKLLVEAGVLDAKIRNSINAARLEDRQLRITLEYEALHKLLELITSYADQVSSTKKKALLMLRDKVQNLMALFKGPGQRLSCT
jgi:hypothetical protein